MSSCFVSGEIVMMNTPISSEFPIFFAAPGRAVFPFPGMFHATRNPSFSQPVYFKPQLPTASLDSSAIAGKEAL